MIASNTWDGDLQKMCSATWVEDDSDVAAIAIVQDGYARVWFNLRHIRIHNERIIWHWGRRAATLRPFDVLHVGDIPSAWNDDREVIAS